MNRVIHFEIHTSDPERAAAFYRQVFGWQVDEWIIPGVQLPPENRYWVVTTGTEPEAGINGGIVIRRGAAPAEGQAVNAFVCTIKVTSVDESVQRVIAAGGTVALPKMPIRGLGWLAYCKDLSGNIFGMMSDDPRAG